MNETQMSLFIIMAEHAIAAIQGGSFRDGVHTFKERAKFTAGKGHDFLQSWFFVKFWGAKVSMHSWRGHALNTVRVLFRCVC